MQQSLWYGGRQADGGGAFCSFFFVLKTNAHKTILSIMTPTHHLLLGQVLSYRMMMIDLDGRGLVIDGR